METAAKTLLERLLGACTAARATDLHLSAGSPPRLRVDGELQPMEGEVPLGSREIEAIVGLLLHEGQQRVLADRLALDFAHTAGDGTRFRVNAYRERHGLAVAVRRLESVFRSLEDWGLPGLLAETTRLRDGLVLVTGPTGCGKSTTLACLLHLINRERACHIITVEDPIEYVHENIRALVNQRELHTTVRTFAEAVRSALREDPDVILVGEMRDLETMRTALTAAETGHLVFSTLHTGDAVGAVERLVGAFPSGEQGAIRQRLSLVLRQVVAQRLLPRRAGRGLVPAVEILHGTSAVAHLVRTGRTEQLRSVIENGAEHGMRTLEQDLASLVVRGAVTRAAAAGAARDPAGLETWLKRSEAGTWR